MGSFEPPQLADVARQGRLYLLAEGISGAAGGDSAARFAVQQTLHTFFTSPLNDPQARLSEAANRANSDIFQRNQLHPRRRPLAATFTAALIHNNRLLVANAGDNRAYVVWDQDIEQLTAHNANPKQVDDSPVRIIAPDAVSPPAEPAPDSFSAKLPGGLGLEPAPALEIYARRLFVGDIVVLVSGSLTGYLEPKEIARAVNLHPPEPAIRRLIALAGERGHRDGCAICVIRILSDPIGKRPPKAAPLPVAPTWADVSQPLPAKEDTTDTRPMSGGAAAEPGPNKPKFTRPPNFMPDASRRRPSPRLLTLLAVVVLLLLCSGLFVAARALLPPERLASLPMAASLGLVDAPTGDEPQVVRLPSPTPLITPTSAASPEAQATAETDSAGSSPVGTPTAAPQSGSSFSSPISTPESSAADVVSVSPLATPSPTPLPLPTIELPPGCETRGRFVRDVTIPDGTQLAPGEQFDKVWRVNNAETCPWGPGYTLRFLEGNPMGAAASLPLTQTVQAGEDTELGVTLTAPTQPGQYQATWQLHDLSGQPFGPELYLEIEVTTAAIGAADVAQLNTLYDFVANAEAATWTSGDTGYTVLRSPISDTMELPRPQGLVAVGPAQLRGNKTSQNDALLTYPHLETGFIEGRYRVDTPLQPSDTFVAEVGFTKLSILSDDGVTFEVTFTPDGGETVTLFSSPVDYRESPSTQLVPLDGIAPNSTGEFMLRVLGGDSLNQDWALWINARLVRP